jgi:hypothetical protein
LTKVGDARGVDLVPILFVNGKRRGLRIRGSAAVSNPARKRRPRYGAPDRPPHHKRRKARQPVALARYWAKHGTRTRRRHRMPKPLRDYWAKHRRNPAGRRRAGNAHPWAVKKRRRAALKGWRSRKNRSPRSNSMAKGSKKRSAAMKRYWRARKRAGKMGALGRTKRRRARRSGGGKKRRARKSVHRKRARARRSHASRRRRRRTVHTTIHGVRVTRPSRRRRKGRRATKRMSSRRLHMLMGPEATTVRMNPGRRRRKRRRSHRRGYTVRRRRSHRRGRRRSYRRYRRNPGIGDIFTELKRVIPVAVSFLANRMVVNKFGPMLPVVSSLGTLQGPVLSVASLLLTNFVTKKVGALSRYREQAMMGAGFQALASLWTAFAPASIQSAVGDYVNMGDYVAVGAAPPLNERITMSDYVAVGADGVEQELGMGVEEELGVDEELGNVLLGGLPGPTSGSMAMLKQVPSQAFIQPIPARSFTKGIPGVTPAFDASADLYAGIFGGKFGGGG